MGLSCASSVVWDCHPVAFASSRSCEGFVLLQYAVVGLQTVLAWPIVEGMVNPTVLV